MTSVCKRFLSLVSGSLLALLLGFSSSQASDDRIELWKGLFVGDSPELVIKTLKKMSQGSVWQTAKRNFSFKKSECDQLGKNRTVGKRSSLFSVPCKDRPVVEPYGAGYLVNASMRDTEVFEYGGVAPGYGNVWAVYVKGELVSVAVKYWRYEVPGLTPEKLVDGLLVKYGQPTAKDNPAACVSGTAMSWKGSRISIYFDNCSELLHATWTDFYSALRPYQPTEPKQKLNPVFVP